jgi:hypothetical protein
MTLQTKNLGFVKAIFVGPTAPLNTNAIWRDTSVSPAIHKHYDTSLSQWKSLTQNISTANLTWTSDTTQNLNSKTLTLKDGVVLFNNTTVKIDTLANNDAGTKILVAATDGTIQYRNSSTLIPTAYALTKVDDTNITLTLGGTPASALLAATSITVGWSGTLADGRIASAATWNAKIGGSGTTNTLPKFTGGSTIGNSQITDDGTTVNITASTLRIGGYTTNGFVKTSAGTGLITVSTQVAATEGGTGRSSWTANSLVYIGATNTFGEILASTNGHVLTMVAGTPAWAALSVSLTSQVTGVLPIANGGTNLSALGSALQYLRVNSGGTALEYATLSAPNIYTASDTITDDARTVTLKTGTTATQNFQIKNSAGKTGYYFDGVGRTMLRTSTTPADIGGEPVNLVFGDTTNMVTAYMYLTNTGSSQYTALKIFGGSSLLQYIDARGGQYWQNQNGLGTDIEFRQYGNGARIYINSGGLNTWNQFLNMSAEGHQQITFSAAGSTTATKGGLIEIYNGAGDAVKSVLTGNRSQVEAVWFADGMVLGGTRGRSATPFFDVMGSGSTSATTTALFKNSTNLTAFEVRDDLAVSMYNNGGYVTNRFFNKGAIIGGNNNGSTTADPNNVLGGSYANGVIIGGYNNTHNGYLGVVGGGSGSTIAADKAQCVALGGGNNITGDYAMALSTVATVSGNFAAVIGGYQNTASGEGAVALGGNQAIASGYRSFSQGYGSYASAHYAVTFGSYSSASARSARAVGEFCVASGVSSWVSGLGADYGGTGKELKASGVVSFNHSYNDGLVASRAAEGDYSVILGGKNHWAKSGSTSSVILGGEGNTINASVLRSVILGGSGITATANDTVYGVNFEASTLVTTPQVINTPFTVTVASNAGTITRAYRENKFTNSSASAMTITISTTGALDGDIVRVRIYDFSAAAQTITWVNTENSSVTVPATSNGSTTLPLTVGFQYNSATSKWRCIGSV